MCVRMLRSDAEKLGFTRNFTIYDTDDSKRVIKDILKELNLEEKTFPPRSVLAAISHAKDQYETPEDFARVAEPYIRQSVKDPRFDTARIAALLQARCEKLTDIPEKVDFFDTLPDYIREQMETRAQGVNSLESLKDYAENLLRGDD